MPAAISLRDRLPILLVLALLAAFGSLLALEPTAALVLVLACLAVALAFAAPVANLTLILFLTIILPNSVQSAYVIGGGTDTPGLFLSDVLLIAGLARVVPDLMSMRLERRRLLAAVAVALFLAIALLQMVHGIAAGWDHSEAGGECRALLYFGTFLLALPIVADEGARERLLKSLVGLGLLIGLWGIAQWVLGVDFDGDIGVRPGVRGTSGGHGQLQGGLYAFPVATVIALAILVSGQIRSSRGRVALVAVAALNAISLLLTYERSLWLGATVGMAFVALRLGRTHRARALVGIASLLAVVLLSLAALAPSLLTTARERLFYLGRYSNDSAFHYRVVESGHVLDEIRDHPIAGSGLGAAIFWGQPWANLLARNHAYTHNAYLALAWKLGVPAALLLIALLVWAIAARGPPSGGPRHVALRNGCQGGLLALLIIGMAFPSFTTIKITGAMGVMLAVCAFGPGSGGAGSVYRGPDRRMERAVAAGERRMSRRDPG
jgi:O-antigen ligase